MCPNLLHPAHRDAPINFLSVLSSLTARTTLRGRFAHQFVAAIQMARSSWVPSRWVTLTSPVSRLVSGRKLLSSSNKVVASLAWGRCRCGRWQRPRRAAGTSQSWQSSSATELSFRTSPYLAPDNSERSLRQGLSLSPAPPQHQGPLHPRPGWDRPGSRCDHLSTIAAYPKRHRG